LDTATLSAAAVEDRRWGQLIVKVSEQQTDEVFQRSDAPDVFVKETHIQFLLQLRLRRLRMPIQ
jgi:hypothetical protein